MTDTLTTWVNSLPDPYRRYIHDLQANADPAGTLQENVMLREDRAALIAKVAERDAEIASLANLRVERREFEKMREDKEEALAQYRRVREEIRTNANAGWLAQLVIDKCSGMNDPEAWVIRSAGYYRDAVERADRAESELATAIARADAAEVALRTIKDAAEQLRENMLNGCGIDVDDDVYLPFIAALAALAALPAEEPKL